MTAKRAPMINCAVVAAVLALCAGVFATSALADGPGASTAPTSSPLAFSTLPASAAPAPPPGCLYNTVRGYQDANWLPSACGEFIYFSGDNSNFNADFPNPSPVDHCVNGGHWNDCVSSGVNNEGYNVYWYISISCSGTPYQNNANTSFNFSANNPWNDTFQSDCV